MTELKCYFKKIHNQLDASFNRALRKYGLTSTQFDILAFLSENTNGQTTLTDISAHFCVKHTSVIHVLKILEKNGFISKSKSTDGRSKTITLTSRGLEVVAEIQKKSPLVSRILFDGLSESELRQLEKMLDRIYTNLESDAFQNLYCTPITFSAQNPTAERPSNS